MNFHEPQIKNLILLLVDGVGNNKQLWMLRAATVYVEQADENFGGSCCGWREMKSQNREKIAAVASGVVNN